MPAEVREGSQGLSAGALALRDELAGGRTALVARLRAGDATVEVRRGHDSLWVLVRREGQGGFALRTAHSPGVPLRVEAGKDAQGHQFHVMGSLGTFRVTLHVPDPAQSLLRCTVRLTPAEDVLLPEGPRDLYPLNERDDPGGAAGTVHAAQRGLNTGLVYLSLTEPEFGGLLYFQNLTALNPYFAMTDTTPDGVVGGQWPELGYAMPISKERPLRQGEEVTLSDVFLHWCSETAEDPRRASRLFLDLLAGVYRHLERPEPEYHDWPRLASETVRDLERSPDATVRHYGNLFLRPYTASEEPDSMVQLTVLLPMREYQAWTGEALELTGELRKGVKRFFDPELGVMRRYLPNASGKDQDLVDSWYLYHPLTNLARLAWEDDGEARELFLRSLEYGIKIARHFRYQWPVQYKLDTLEVVTGPRKPGDPGQSDVGGLYAYIALHAYEMTGEKRYLGEAKKAVQALKDMEFDLEYQSNITAWGAGACLRLWKITGEDFYRDQSYVFLASFFHNSLIWESEIGHARSYPIFLGVTCLHDGPYMALYECFESVCAFHEYLNWGGDDLPDSVRLLLTEYGKYALSRAWYYYPKELPEEALATEIRNGHIDRELAFPLEDLYADGQPAGQVGQEIYGCGAAFAFTTRAYHRLERAPFLLFCEYPVYDLAQPDEPCVSFAVRGAEGLSCRVRLIPTGRAPLPDFTLQGVAGDDVTGRMTPEGHCEFTVPVGDPVEIHWKT